MLRIQYIINNKTKKKPNIKNWKKYQFGSKQAPKYVSIRPKKGVTFFILVLTSDFLDLFLRRLFTFWRCLFAAWSAFLVEAALQTK